MMGELLAMDAVVSSMYDWATVCGEAARMASRITGRPDILVPTTIAPDRLAVMQKYSESVVNTKFIDYNHETGQLDLEDLKKKISSKTAGVYIENPSYLGFIETQGEEIAEIAHDKGALSIVGVEPSSLGVLTPPGEYGADIVIGEGQPLGMHMTYGGALLGIMAFPAEPKFMTEAPRGIYILTTAIEPEDRWAFLRVRLERSLYTARERGISFTGTASMLWSITAAVYMALVGPQGIRELGEVIIQKSHYAMKLISEIAGLRVPLFNAPHFEEFIINFDETDMSVREVNTALLKHGICGGKDISTDFPELGRSALYCVTETHSEESIENLATTLGMVLEGDEN
jgi:glycine dehydrogenase subunit 1